MSRTLRRLVVGALVASALVAGVAQPAHANEKCLSYHVGLFGVVVCRPPAP